VITSVDNPRVKEVLRLRRSRERRASGLLVAEGRREIERALDAGLVLCAAYVAPELVDDWPHPAESVSARVLAKMSYRQEPEGVLAIFEAPQRSVPPDATLVLVAVGIEKPGNLGAMARTADAAGADALIVAGVPSDPWNPNAIRSSTGAVFTLPIVDATLDDVRALPLRRVAAVVGAPTSYADVDLTSPTAVIVGAEDAGLDTTWQAVADERVALPMLGRTADSLNAATAAGVLLYEAVRQRGALVRE
jgi:TrmH family RNA methyltransferase